GDTWRDQEHDRFRQEFEQTMQALERFVEVSGEHIPFLLRKAERIEEYLSQRCVMADQADVRSIDAVREWHAALTAYGESLSEAMAGVELELRRAFDWLAEQLDRWKKAIRECEQEVVQAKAELSARKFPGWDGREPDTTVQERELRRAKARLEHAEDQVEKVRAWIGRLPQVIDEVYRGPAHRLVNFL